MIKHKQIEDIVIRLKNSSRQYEIYPYYDYSFNGTDSVFEQDKNDTIGTEVDLFAVDYINGKPNLLLFDFKEDGSTSSRVRSYAKLHKAIGRLKYAYGEDSRVQAFFGVGDNLEWWQGSKFDNNGSIGLEDKLIDKNLSQFEDIFNPLKFKAYLRYVLELPKYDSNKLSNRYERIYNSAKRLYKRKNER